MRWTDICHLKRFRTSTRASLVLVPSLGFAPPQHRGVACFTVSATHFGEDRYRGTFASVTPVAPRRRPVRSRALANETRVPRLRAVRPRERSARQHQPGVTSIEREPSTPQRPFERPARASSGATAWPPNAPAVPTFSLPVRFETEHVRPSCTHSVAGGVRFLRPRCGSSTSATETRHAGTPKRAFDPRARVGPEGPTARRHQLMPVALVYRALPHRRPTSHDPFTPRREGSRVETMREERRVLVTMSRVRLLVPIQTPRVADGEAAKGPGGTFRAAKPARETHLG